MTRIHASGTDRAPRRSLAHRALAALAVAIMAVTGALVGAVPAQAANGTITGLVAAGDTSTGLNNVNVRVLESGGSFSGLEAFSDANGEYTITAVPSGTYLLHFIPEAGTGYGPVYSGSVEQRVDAEQVFVPSGGGVFNFVVVPVVGAVSGHVTFSGAASPILVTLSVYDSTTGSLNGFYGASVDEFGNWERQNVKPGYYKVSFRDVAEPRIYQSEFFNNMAQAVDSEFVEVIAKQTTTNIDATLTTTALSNVVRLAGSDRFATSARIAHEFPFSDVVFVANGLDFPDALSAAPAAAHLSAPLLLTRKDSLPAIVKAQIVRLHPAIIYVVGGTGVVSEAVFNELNALASDQAIRLAGPNRYTTSQAVYSTIWDGETSEHVFLADGRNFPDALSSASAAAWRDGPVVLVNGGGTTLPAGLSALLQATNTGYIAIAGGAAVVSNAILADADAVPGVTATRFSGANRYKTSVEINEEFFGVWEPVFLAVGTGYADALAGAALAGLQDGPLYLVPGHCVPQDVLDRITDPTNSRVVLLGGTGVLSNAVENMTSCTPTS